MNSKIKFDHPGTDLLVRTIAENSIQGLAMMDAQGYCIYANRTLLDMTGFNEDEIRSKPLHDLVHHHYPDGRPFPISECPIGCALGRNENVRNHEDLFFRKDGTPFHVVCAASPIVQDGLPVSTVLEFRDITEIKFAAAQYRDTEEMFRSTFQHLAVGIAHVGKTTRIIRANQKLCDMLGYSEAELCQKTFTDITLPDDKHIGQEEFKHAIAGEIDSFSAEKRYLRRDGTHFWAKVTGLIVKDQESGEFKYNIAVIEDITERKRNEAALMQADQRKDEFLAMLAHELRNPLAPISAAADLLSLPKSDPERISQASEIITRQVRHMTSLINDLLDVSRVTKGVIKLDAKPVDLREVVKEAVEQVQPMFAARRHKLELNDPVRNMIVSGDPKRLVQIFANLLSNAAKYTPDQGSIIINMSANAGRAIVSVLDNGIGIGPELLPNIFDLFTQAERTSDRIQGGLGLGLALVKNLVEIQGGTVQAFSAGLKKGSEFIVSLPLTDKIAQSPERLSSLSALPETQKLNLLVVDDNKDAARTLALLMEAFGHSVRYVHGAYEALEEVTVAMPDACLIDIGLPGLDGNELARRLRTLPDGKTLMLIAVTGYGQEQDIIRSKSAGFDHHLVKPVHADELNDLLFTIKVAR